MKLTITLAALCAVWTTSASADDEAVQAPEPGTYEANVYVQYANGNSNCLGFTGDNYSALVGFSGLNGTTLYFRTPEVGNYEATVSITKLAVKSGRGTLNPSGALTWTDPPNSWTNSGTFSASITEIGTHAFVMLLSESYSGCVEDLNVSLARVSADP